MDERGATPDARGGNGAGSYGERGWGSAAPAQAAAPFTSQTETKPRMGPPPAPPAPPPYDELDDARDTRKRKKVTDSARMPALRLNRRDRAPREAPKPHMVYEMGAPPAYLRPARLVFGLAALAAAWGAALAVIYLTQGLWTVLPKQPIVSERFVLYILSAIGILWLAVVGVALILVGAFSLFLALVRRGW